MTAGIVLKHEFVEFIPDRLEQGTIYVSIRFATASHLCCCGCGNKVVTPIRPTDWKLIFDGKTVSLDPSIGNWSFTCQSHYWIKCNRVRWAPTWSRGQVEQGRLHDRCAKEEYFSQANAVTDSGVAEKTVELGIGKAERTFWRGLKKWWS
jgi:hypothetical protein